MYSNNKKGGFSILDLIVKIIFALLFVFLLIWLFNKKVPNMKPFYSNQFRENIKYMQDAAEAYFTDDKMPKTAGESVRLSLEEMENMNLILPFVDKDGNSCDKKNSYVSITKLETEEAGYELKTNLVCGSEKNHIVKTLGCHTYCPYGNCGTAEKKCSISKITEYQHKKLVSGTYTKYSCPSGYTLKGKNCYKTILKDSKSAIVKKTETKTDVKNATMVKEDAKLKELAVTKGTKTETKAATENKTTESKNATANTSTETKAANKSTDTKTPTKKSTTETKAATPSTQTKAATPSTQTKAATNNPKTVSYNCTKYRTVTQCSTQYRQEAYSCNCKTTTSQGRNVTTCNTCYRSVPYQSCKDVQQSYTDTCYRTENSYSCASGWTLSGTTCSKTTYSCSSGWTLNGTNCNRTVTTDTCPSGYTLSGSNCTKTNYSCASGWTLSGTNCSKTSTTYTCPSGYTLNDKKCNKTVVSYTCASGWTLSNKTCSKVVTTYTCPSGTDVKEGSGSSLRCYKLIDGKVSYTCPSGYTLSGTTCKKTYTTTVTTKQCTIKGYKLVGDKCNLYETKTAKATAKTVNSSSYKYMWSKEKEVDGYTPTGKTRTVDGEEVCN